MMKDEYEQLIGITARIIRTMEGTKVICNSAGYCGYAKICRHGKPHDYDYLRCSTLGCDKTENMGCVCVEVQDD